MAGNSGGGTAGNLLAESEYQRRNRGRLPLPTSSLCVCYDASSILFRSSESSMAIRMQREFADSVRRYFDSWTLIQTRWWSEQSVSLLDGSSEGGQYTALSVTVSVRDGRT